MLRVQQRNEQPPLTLTVRVAFAQEQFQVRFWKLRQAEYSPYLLQCSPLRVRRTISLILT